jgi:hypothetical protein
VGALRRDHLHNEVIREQSGETNSVHDIEKYRLQWRNHPLRMKDTWLPKKTFYYKPRG